MERQDISPAVYHMLQNSQPTSASVERSFSMLSWLMVQNLRIALSRVFISFEAFRLTLIKKDRQNGEHRIG